MPIKMDSVKAQSYIIIYNDGSDFIECGDKESAERAIEDLITQDGHAQDDIEVYEANQVEFNVKRHGIEVEIAS